MFKKHTHTHTQKITDTQIFQKQMNWSALPESPSDPFISHDKRQKIEKMLFLISLQLLEGPCSTSMRNSVVFDGLQFYRTLITLWGEWYCLRDN